MKMRRKPLKLYIVIIWVLSFQGCMDCKTGYEKVVKPEVIDGIIVDCDSIHNHGIPVIKIQDSNDNIMNLALDNSLKSLRLAFRINDSIYKAKDSYAFHIIRKDTTLTFYPVCGCCDTLK